MKKSWGKLFLLSLALLTAASCGRPTVTQTQTTIDQAMITTGVDFANKAENQVTSISAGTPSIYLSAEVNHPDRRTTVQVQWSKSGSVIATEKFSGQNQTGGSQFDFDSKTSQSFFASQVDRPGTSWSVGAYKAEISLNGKLYQTLTFQVISDLDADQAQAAALVKKVSFGDKVDAENNLLDSATTFAPETAHIYTSVDLGKVPASSDIQISIRYVKDNVLATTYKVQYQSGTNLTIEVDSDKVFRKSHVSQLWPSGAYEVTVAINGLAAPAKTFVVS